jgi:mono/diheme cytochrome c family protein
MKQFRALFAGLLATTCAVTAARDAAAAVDPQTKATLDQYCVTCHNARLKTGGFVLDTSSLEHVTTDRDGWEKVVRKLRLGVMPPFDAPPRRRDLRSSD